MSFKTFIGTDISGLTHVTYVIDGLMDGLPIKNGVFMVV